MVKDQTNIREILSEPRKVIETRHACIFHSDNTESMQQNPTQSDQEVTRVAEPFMSK